ncbi:MAG TPA: NHL repeat-containing protein [Candidatus Binatia bacterium]|nr:NHL repeat-containing protein [Candidatus Binatia bacterium]
MTYWPAIDPLTGDVWVSSSDESRLWVFKPDGTFVREFGSQGSGPGQFRLMTNDPSPDPVGAIAFAPDGTLFVADDGNYRIDEFDPKGTFVRSWGSFGTDDDQFISPKGIATDGKLVYVGDDSGTDGCCLKVFDVEGHSVRSIQNSAAGVYFSLAPSGQIISAGTDDSGTGVVDLMDATGDVVASHPIDVSSYFLPSLHSLPPTSEFGWGAADAVEDRSGRIFVSLADDKDPMVGLLELDKQGTVIREWPSGGGLMALAPDGSAIYTAAGGSPVYWPFLAKYALPKS